MGKPMKALVVASCKGGSGKSLVSANLATRLAKGKGERVAMIDLDGTQGTLTKWWCARGRGVAPYLLEEPGSVSSDVRALAADGYTWCVIDTPPLDMKVIEFAVNNADLVVIPVMLSAPDVESAKSIVGLCNRWRKPYRFLINSFDSRPAFKKANAEAFAQLPRGAVFETRLPDHAKFREGWQAGKAGSEADKTLGSALSELVDEIKALLPQKAKGAANG